MTKPRTQDVSPNKLSAAQQQQIEQARSRLQQQGLGRDEAEKQAIREVVGSTESGQGGGTNAAGESKKGAEHRGPKQRPSSGG